MAPKAWTRWPGAPISYAAKSRSIGKSSVSRCRSTQHRFYRFWEASTRYRQEEWPGSCRAFESASAFHSASCDLSALHDRCQFQLRFSLQGLRATRLVPVSTGMYKDRKSGPLGTLYCTLYTTVGTLNIFILPYLSSKILFVRPFYSVSSSSSSRIWLRVVLVLSKYPAA